MKHATVPLTIATMSFIFDVDWNPEYTSGNFNLKKKTLWKHLQMTSFLKKLENFQLSTFENDLLHGYFWAFCILFMNSSQWLVSNRIRELSFAG